MIGTGSSGVQAIPVIAEQAEHLTVFQRTPQYTIPARHENVDRRFIEEEVKPHYDEIWEKARRSKAGFPADYSERSALEVSAEERLETYEDLWTKGGDYIPVRNIQRHSDGQARERHRRRVHPVENPGDRCVILRRLRSFCLLITHSAPSEP